MNDETKPESSFRPIYGGHELNLLEIAKVLCDAQMGRSVSKVTLHMGDVKWFPAKGADERLVAWLDKPGHL